MSRVSDDVQKDVLALATGCVRKCGPCAGFTIAVDQPREAPGRQACLLRSGRARQRCLVFSIKVRAAELSAKPNARSMSYPHVPNRRSVSGADQMRWARARHGFHHNTTSGSDSIVTDSVG